MSKRTQLPPQDEAYGVIKKDRREQKEKRDKDRAKKTKPEKHAVPENEEEEVAADAASEDGNDEADTKPKETPKKRKREALPEEIEIDVNLPEPASKKAARKAKKAKLNPTTTSTTDGNAGDSADTKENGKEAVAAKRSDFGIWVGNLPWSATKELLRNFLVENAEIKAEDITRVHMPPPTKPANPRWTTKPMNKGFAYVDFTTELAMYSAIALTETKMDGRALLIKNAKSFEGRPDKPKTAEEEDTTHGKKGKPKSTNPPNNRVFVGNLAFDVTKEDLQAHYEQCGPIAHTHMATFEDTGKCKGYAWITFQNVEAATCAVQGYILKSEDEIAGHKKKKTTKGSDENSENESDAEASDKKKSKKRKWLLNKLMGRDLRCEFAEDSTTRYNKRFGKEKQDEPIEPIEGVNPERMQNFQRGGRDGGRGGGRSGRGRGGGGGGGFRGGRPQGKFDSRNIKSGDAHMNAPRQSQAIVESQGKKTTFA